MHPPPRLRNSLDRNVDAGEGLKEILLSVSKEIEFFPLNELFMSHFLTIRDLFFYDFIL